MKFLSLTLPTMGVFIQKTVLVILVLLLIILSGITLHSYTTIRQIDGLTENLDYSRKQNLSDISGNKIVRLKYTDADFAQLREHVDQIDTLILRGSSLDITTSPVNIAVEKGYYVNTIKQYLANIAPNINVFIELEGAFAAFDGKQLGRDELSTVVDSFVGYIESNNYRGIAINNNENASLANSPLLSALVVALKSKGKKIIVVQNPNYTAVTPQLQKTFDSVLLFPQTITPSKLEGQKWTNTSLLLQPTQIAQIVKTFVKDHNISSYTLLLDTTTYRETKENGQPIWQAYTSYSDILNDATNSEITYPVDKPVPTIVEKVNDYVSNYTYLADSTYVYNIKVALTKEAQLLQPKIIGLSSEMPPEPGVWSVINNGNTQSNLANIKGNFLIDTKIEQSGKGSILKYIQDVIPGSRTIELVNDFITGQSITKLPQPAKIQRFGFKENVVSITFDDGPDADTTPKILDILKSKGIKATFYLEGSHVKTNIDLAKRIVNEGHGIANHTYNHPSSYKLPANTYTKELEATDRITHLSTGFTTNLYRTPFNEANSFQTLSDGDNLKFLNSKGYMVSEFDIDSYDYKNISGSDIEANVLKSLTELKGGQILFHDHNNVSRTEMLNALPTILDEIKAKGYQFARSDELVDAQEYFAEMESPRSKTKAMYENKNVEYWVYTIGRFLLNNIYLLVIFALIIMMYWYKVI